MKTYGTIDYISGQNEAYGRFYVLRKSTPGGDQLIVIQASAVVPESHMEIEVAMRCFPEWDRQFEEGLETIQTLLPTIQFGRTNWAHLIGSANNYRIVLKQQPLPIVTEMPWCPLVEERDIEVTGWVWAQDRHGVWNGKEVDLFMAWDHIYVGFLAKTMAAYKLLIKRNLEHLAYPAVGHVVRNGTADICGIMTEPAYGRMVEFKDKSAVYKAVAQIERAGLLYTGLKASNVMLTDDGQVRLTGLCALGCQPEDPTARAKDLAFWHWEELERLFKELECGPNPIPPQRKMARVPLCLPPFPAPERAPSITTWAVCFYHGPDFTQDSEEACAADNSDAPRAVERRRPHAGDGHMEVLVFDAPVSARSLRTPRARLVARATVPYRKPDKLMQELLRAQSWRAGADKLTLS
ncbi:hypothetical protein C8R44DRAFT_9100 [Mycena epipterygia]|nr:hypothetical protein C8R44DRAFT_9100 [Mycena epipterygia]